MSKAYYNENDPKAAAWLRELIKAGHIPPGEVDERSIVDVQPGDLVRFTQCHFFAGIGGWSLALRLAGWPEDKPVWTGSCPCQPFSAAGKAQGLLDSRHLWPAFQRLIAERRPAIVFGEQVASKDGRLWLAGIRTELEGMGYAVGAADLCAAGVGAPHIRQRLYWVAHAQHPERWPELEAQRTGLGRSGPGGSQRLGHPQQPGLEGHAGNVNGGNEPGRLDPRTPGPASETGAVGGVAESEHPIRRAVGGPEQDVRDGNDTRRPEAHSESGTCGEVRAGGLGNTGSIEQRGLPSDERDKVSTPWGTGENGPWSRYNLIPCRDGKARRVESGTFPLADGVPGRVGLLRGYGNAIVPQVAAVFIKSCVEAIADLAQGSSAHPPNTSLPHPDTA